MGTVDISSAEFTKTIEDNDLVIVDFWADWCGPCKRFAPVYSKVSEDHPGVVFAKFDTETDNAFAGELGIQAIPTLMAFHKGKLVFNQAGALNQPQLTSVVDQLEKFDPAEAEKSENADHHTHQ